MPRMPDFSRYVLQVTIKEPQPMLVPIKKDHIPRGEKPGRSSPARLSLLFMPFSLSALVMTEIGDT